MQKVSKGLSLMAISETQRTEMEQAHLPMLGMLGIFAVTPSFVKLTEDNDDPSSASVDSPRIAEDATTVVVVCCDASTTNATCPN